MSDFNPYHQWLGISETARPVSKYRLLGIDEFESDRDVISAAAEQRTIYLRTLQAGEHEVLVAQLLNEVSQARVTLLNADQKAEYDEELRKQQAPHRKVQEEIWKRPAVIGVSVVGVIGVLVLFISQMFSGDADPVASNTPPVVSGPLIPRPVPEPQTDPVPQPKTPPTLPPQPEPEPVPQSAPRTLAGHTDSVFSVAFSPDGKNIASGSMDHTIKLWDVGTGAELKTLKAHTGNIWSVAFSPDGTMIASGSDDETIKVHHKTRDDVNILAGHTGSVFSVAFSPDGKMIASGSKDNTIKLWDVETWVEMATFTGHTNWVRGLDFSPDGETFASISKDGTVKIWEIETGNVLHTIASKSSIYTNHIKYSPDGTRISFANISRDGFIVFDIQTRTEIAAAQSHPQVRGLAWSPDGQMIASGSEHSSLKLWNSKTVKEIWALKAHTGIVWSVAFSPDGKMIASGSEDNTVKLWDIEPEPAPATANTLPASLQEGLVAYYPFNGNAQDESGNGNHGFVRGTQADVDRHGNKRSCYQLTERDTWIELPAITSELSERTFALWLNVPTHNETFRPIISQHSVSGEDNLQVVFNLQIHNSNKLDYFMGDRTRLIVEDWPRIVLNTGIWVHLCFSYTATHTAFYINGQSQGKRKLDGVPLNSQQPIQLGKFSNNKAVPDQFLNGSLDDIRIYNRALSTAEVKSLYDFESKPPASPLRTVPAIESTTNTIGMTLNKIPAGTFMMGSPEGEPDRSDNEHQHKVTISKPFYMQTTEVTQEQWKEVMGTEPWKGAQFVKEGPNYAATWVSWDDAVAYCEKLSQKESKTYRLPTEAEWEYACRAGTETRWSFSNDEKDLGDYAWHKENARDIGEEYAHQVGLKKPNAFGLYDMHGNVWEWCHDYFEADYYERSPEQDPRGPQGSASDSSRVLRGGSWFYETRYARFASRNRSDKVRYLSVDFGFRLVRELD